VSSSLAQTCSMLHMIMLIDEQVLRDAHQIQRPKCTVGALYQYPGIISAIVVSAEFDSHAAATTPPTGANALAQHLVQRKVCCLTVVLDQHGKSTTNQQG